MARVARDALLTKYSLLPVLYTLFFIHSTAGETVVRPLWHEFPQDSKTRDIDTQVMNLLCLDDPIIPSLVPLGKLPPRLPNPGAGHFRTVEQPFIRNLITSFFVAIRSAYLPASAVWYDFYTRQKVIGGEVGKSK